MSLSVFNEQKATQAAARFLNLAGGEMNYMVLIKLLYMLDRKTLTEWGRPVTGDEYFSMKLGPVLSEVHDLITEPSEEGYWHESIAPTRPYCVGLMHDPGTKSLSQAELEQIQAVFEDFKNYVNPKDTRAPFHLADHLHSILPEWTQIEHGRVPLPVSDILKTKKLDQPTIAAIEDELSMLAFVDEYLSIPSR